MFLGERSGGKKILGCPLWREELPVGSRGYRPSAEGNWSARVACSGCGPCSGGAPGLYGRYPKCKELRPLRGALRASLHSGPLAPCRAGIAGRRGLPEEGQEHPPNTRHGAAKPPLAPPLIPMLNYHHNERFNEREVSASCGPSPAKTSLRSRI